jgi:hypothetical protein
MPPKKSRPSKGVKSDTSSKRKAVADDPEPRETKRARSTEKKQPQNKKTKQTQTSADSADKLEKPIVINRAPVLELWGACVASFLHPELPWNACLNVGSSISTLTAISKGRSIGTIVPPDPNAKKDKKKDTGGEDLTTFKIMGFPMTTKDDGVTVKGKVRTVREANVTRKWGEENLERVKTIMMDALKTWKGDENELDKKAFHMYEQFRPEVAKGQRGWGKKGELYLPKVENAIRK